MASKAEQWKRLHGLMLDSELVYVAVSGTSTWMTDRYVLVDLNAARQSLYPEPGTWRLRASAGPVTDSSAGTLADKSVKRMLGKLASLSWQPADVTPWALADDEHDCTYRLLVAGGEPVLMNDDVIRSWPAAFPEKADTVIWHAARFPETGARVASATLRHDYGAAAKAGPSEHVFGYLIGTSRQLDGPLPPFPDLSGQAAAIDGLSGLVRDVLQSMPDTADEQEWRDRAGALGLCDPDGHPYRAYTEEDL